ncbi:hypothetical protein AYJ54_42900 [Bradyrhizobium centrolobii]|uniref:Uncharacterized protein n=1 Tax=Bradyrhizobium centrolobii TaxID=1505087 RepID=A0A176Z3N5_9BRAD|nr:hypothetical protein AYJ54_42900 [Bradyrhizobium centrolobii]
MGRFGETFVRGSTWPRSVRQAAPPASIPNEAKAKRMLAEASMVLVPERACTTAAEAYPPLRR